MATISQAKLTYDGILRYLVLLVMGLPQSNLKPPSPRVNILRIPSKLDRLQSLFHKREKSNTMQPGPLKVRLTRPDGMKFEILRWRSLIITQISIEFKEKFNEILDKYGIIIVGGRFHRR